MEKGKTKVGVELHATNPHVPCGYMCGLFDEDGEPLIKVSGYMRGMTQVDAYLRRAGDTVDPRGPVINKRENIRREQPTIDLMVPYLKEQGYEVVASVLGDKIEDLKYPDSEYKMDIKALTAEGKYLYIEVDGSNDISREKYDYLMASELTVYKVDVNSDVVQQYIKTCDSFKELMKWYEKVVEPARQVKLITKLEAPIEYSAKPRGDGKYSLEAYGIWATVFELRGRTRMRINSGKYKDNFVWVSRDANLTAHIPDAAKILKELRDGPR